MRVYFAPLEGTTGALFRRLHRRYFGGIDQYYSPFLSPTKEHVFSKREIREILPEHNAGVPVVPQLLTRNAEDFLWAAGTLFDLGYEEVNLNLGCPSGTVTAKGKGAGFLADPEGLERFLEQVYAKARGKISIKTRLGVDGPEEFARLLELFARYPVHELTVHPRVRREFYKGGVHLDAFEAALRASPAPVCYNGDLTSAEELEGLRKRFPSLERVMIGRGFLADPSLGEKLRGGPGADKERLRAFHDELYEGYCAAFGSRRNAMMRMKEYWSYHIHLYAESGKYAKRLKKASSPEEFEAAAAGVFRELELLPVPAAEWRERSLF